MTPLNDSRKQRIKRKKMKRGGAARTRSRKKFDVEAFSKAIRDATLFARSLSRASALCTHVYSCFSFAPRTHRQASQRSRHPRMNLHAQIGIVPARAASPLSSLCITNAGLNFHGDALKFHGMRPVEG